MKKEHSLTGINSIDGSVSCAALFIAAPASGQGKTTVTSALARWYTNQGKKVRVFKTGPDYLDPQILSQASSMPTAQLDLWMAGEDYCQQMLFDAAQTSDLILIEGAMGLFDGEPSSADLAARFNIPIAIVMDVKGMAQTAAAIALGLAGFRNDYQCAGLIANNCSTQRHAQLIRDALDEKLTLLACLEKDPEIALPERHLGLVQASEVSDQLEILFDKGCQWLEEGVARAENASDNQLLSLTSKTRFYPTEKSNSVAPLLEGKTIAVARDAAFSFIYQSNIELLNKLGATITYFSPLADTILPEADAMWLPGGYPELHSKVLSSNLEIRQQIRDFHSKGKPILAECGGFLYCLAGLTDLDDTYYPMLGILQGEGSMKGKRGCQGMQTAVLPEGDVRGHAHHRSRSSGTTEAIGYGRRQRHPAPGEGIYRDGKLTASYLHLYFASNPEVIARLFTGNLQTNDESLLSLG